MNFSTVRFIFDHAEARSVLYENFSVLHAELQGHAVYVATCRTCRRIVATVPRGGQEVPARPIVDALEHTRTCGGSS